ncbi:YqjF family protein [Paenibacillus glufosinatiresistens]|uniref:YqjF family protein n=1 Tax=Paenibacillus glufosinatiresistens TaxID=3070657 RepID=UPI00286DC68E|nr:DUF2071 domain-containing protein [Paenibacillus sp. YX.27]
MLNRAILSHTAHRPFPLPAGPWVLKQVWRRLLFAHWPVAREELPPLPDGVELDLWDGVPWISLSPFHVDPLRLRWTPPFPGVGRFLEVNLRTYVKVNGVPGIWFFTLEASRRLAVVGARIGGHLPYHRAQMSEEVKGETVHYESLRTTGLPSSRRSSEDASQAAVLKTAYRPLSGQVFNALPGSLLHWLSERYRMYSADRQGRLYTVDIHHLPWPLREVDVTIHTDTLTGAYGLNVPAVPAAATYTERLDVLMWPIRRC